MRKHEVSRVITFLVSFISGYKVKKTKEQLNY